MPSKGGIPFDLAISHITGSYPNQTNEKDTNIIYEGIPHWVVYNRENLEKIYG